MGFDEGYTPADCFDPEKRKIVSAANKAAFDDAIGTISQLVCKHLQSEIIESDEVLDLTCETYATDWGLDVCRVTKLEIAATLDVNEKPIVRTVASLDIVVAGDKNDHDKGMAGTQVGVKATLAIEADGRYAVCIHEAKMLDGYLSEAWNTPPGYDPGY